MVHLHPDRYLVLIPIQSAVSSLNRLYGGVTARVWWLCWWDLGSWASLVTCPLAIFTAASFCCNSDMGLNLEIAHVHRWTPPAPNFLLFYTCSGLWCPFWSIYLSRWGWYFVLGKPQLWKTATCAVHLGATTAPGLPRAVVIVWWRSSRGRNKVNVE